MPLFALIGEKPFECPNCRERFARNSTLKCHLTACQSGAGAKKGRKKLYECQVCNEEHGMVRVGLRVLLLKERD